MNQATKAQSRCPELVHHNVHTCQQATKLRRKPHREILRDNGMGSAWRSRHPSQHRRGRTWVGRGQEVGAAGGQGPHFAMQC